MSIRLDTVRICGFRGIANLEMTLSRVTVLLGQNNAGKTSIIKALQLAIGDYSRYLTDEDFHIDPNDLLQEKIIIDIRFIPISIENKEKIPEFSDHWQQEFGDKIQAQADGNQFVAIRTVAKPDKIKGGYTVERFHLDTWPTFEKWRDHPINTSNRLKKKLECIPFISIDAQRDIHNELKEKSSFVRRILSTVEYNDTDINELEKLVANVNNAAIEKSTSLKNLKTQLDKINHSFDGNGQTELTPFPKKIRDLSKRFSVHYGVSNQSSFSMEYHGMGTRSWASMLTVKAFTDLQVQKHETESISFFPIIAAEEPEAHLHPNAQRTVYNQLINSPGQVIISSHSPYIAGLSDIHEVRYLKIIDGSVQIFQLRDQFESDDLRKLKREVIQSRGELLFSKAIVLTEGETEEQALPDLFEVYSKKTAFELGINFVGVNGSGAKYRPFFILAKDLNIPIYIFSDGEQITVRDLKKNYEKIFGPIDIFNANNITILKDTDFEGYLLEENFTNLIEEAIKRVSGENFLESWIDKRHGTQLKPTKSDKPPCSSCKQPIFESGLRDYSGEEGRKRAILDILDSSKPQYAKAITENLVELPVEQLPKQVINLFTKITSGG